MCALATTAACGDAAAPDMPDNPGRTNRVNDTLAIELTVSPGVISPGSSARIVTQATPPEGREISNFDLRVSGLIDTTIGIPVSGPGTQSAEFHVHVARIRLVGELAFTAVARAGALLDSVTRTARVDDVAKPSITIGLEDPEAATNHSIAITATDDVGLVRLELVVTGAASRRRILQLDTVIRSEGSYSVVIPPAAEVGDSIYVRVTATDLFDKVGETTGVMRVTEYQPPRMDVVLDSLTGERELQDSILLAQNDTVYVSVVLQDNYKLAWWGYSASTFDWVVRDSFPVAGDSAAATTMATPGPTATGPYHLQFFVTDSVGNQGLGRRLRFEALPAIRQPSEVTSERYRPRIIVQDVKRDRVYWAPNDSSFISIVSLDPFAVVGRIPLPRAVNVFDITPSYDSLIVLFDSGTQVGVVNLTLPDNPLDTVQIAAPGEPRPWSVAVDHTNVVHFAVSADPVPPAPFWNYQWDLTSGERTVASNFAVPSVLKRSADGTVIIGDSGARLTRYAVESGDRLTVDRPGGFSSPGVSIDSTGRRILVQQREPVLYDRSFRVMNTFPNFSSARLAINGEELYARVGGHPYFALVRTAGQHPATHVISPETSGLAFPLANGRRLLWVGKSFVTLVHLP